jgi:hypothetical protein
MEDRERTDDNGNESGVAPKEEELETEDRPTEPEPEEGSEDSFPASDPPSY